MVALRLTNGGYRYPGTDRWIFRNLEFSVDEGETVRVTGRNGSGKTTLLKVLAGVLLPSEGTIDGPSKRVAYMDQFAGDMLAHGLTINEHLRLASTDAGVAAAARSKLAEFDIGLSERLDEFVGHLSGGQRQVVALLSTLASGAKVVCLDEFTSSMDERAARVAGQLIEGARQAASTSVLLVSHNAPTFPIDREFKQSYVANALLEGEYV
jgi:ABC-type multidrug transport system ATPase subunit